MAIEPEAPERLARQRRWRTLFSKSPPMRDLNPKERTMATSVMLQHPATGLTRKGYFGYSWTYLFFGWFVPLFRGELGVAALHLLFSLFTFGLWQIIVSFLYNKQYMTRMLEKGYVLKDSESRMAQARAAIGIMPI
jgi:hypothetical protein